ncbi:MAG: HIT domain-containing protein [Chloroflexi bacterium AL-W]|nr:HIT domain-containing protein [Chloroflexi bacterium AL-N1]NOK68982.1 HIT domain-containing protein [Chloroflexi bacterium AL-N10]NOK76965.1 HIT domain-containing protein [Chloroflexi bacterium AL-N5]NOK82647.1 HIT domain-containing protein [Chloroflexi bacterium AL-W]NOK90822.1 HIT domain-containing protein [Chloroflexi bacterium AL-N15]
MIINMEVKFTPWRMAYIKRSDTEQDEGCILCAKGREAPSEDNLVLFQGHSCYVIMNLYPYNTGHLMVVPYEHTADLPGLDSAIAQELFDLTRRCIPILEQTFAPHGFNTGMNLGRTAGAGIDEHLHMHIVPRWNGDTNFMPIVGGTKLIPEALDQSYRKLKPHFDDLANTVQ